MTQGSITNFQPLYRVAQFLALIMLILIPLQIVLYVVAPPPDTVIGLFQLYRQNPFLGLLSLDFLYLLNNIIVAILYLALFLLLYREKPATVLLALILGLIGIACYYPSNPAFEMLTLSNLYFQMLPEQQTLYLAAGEAVMAGYAGTAFNAYYVLSTICLLLFAYALIKSRKLKKSVGLWGFASGLLMIVPSSAGVLGMVFSLLSLVPWVVFVFLLMINFKRLSTNTAL